VTILIVTTTIWIVTTTITVVTVTSKIVTATILVCWGYINKTFCWGNKVIFSVNVILFISKLSWGTEGFLVRNGFGVSWRACYWNFKRFWSLDQDRFFYLKKHGRWIFQQIFWNPFTVLSFRRWREKLKIDTILFTSMSRMHQVPSLF